MSGYNSIPITAPHYPIIYVPGFAPLQSPLFLAFPDAYYGFADTAVGKREVAPVNGKPQFALDIFEGQLVRFMKEHDYVDAYNDGLQFGHDKPERSLWICRFYDRDLSEGRVRPIEEQARELFDMITNIIPRSLHERGVKVFDDEGGLLPDYKVILLAHSMGGLVGRTLIQNLLAQQPKGRRATDLIHRFVTIATPNAGINSGNIPNTIESSIGSALNPLDASLFRPERMREYLGLPRNAPLNSLNGTFPPERCLSIIGSDYRSYHEDVAGTSMQALAGNRSDGLVKQDTAFIEGAYTANVHRTHSGARGIVNSPETYANVQRFLFGDMKVAVSLIDLEIVRENSVAANEFYDLDFRVSIRNTGVYSHQRRQDPCENGWVFMGVNIPPCIPLHTVFLNSKLRPDYNDPYLYFLLELRASEHRPHKVLPWDREYPERVIFSETLELRTTLVEGNQPLQYRWLSENINPSGGWNDLQGEANGAYTLPLRETAVFEGKYHFVPIALPLSSEIASI